MNPLVFLLIGLSIMFALMFYLYYKLSIECEKMKVEIVELYKRSYDSEKYMNSLKMSHDSLKYFTTEEFNNVWGAISNGNN